MFPWAPVLLTIQHSYRKKLREQEFIFGSYFQKDKVYQNVSIICYDSSQSSLSAWQNLFPSWLSRAYRKQTGMGILGSGVNMGIKTFKGLLTVTCFCQPSVISLSFQKPQNNNTNWGITFESISLDKRIQMKIVVNTNKFILRNFPRVGITNLSHHAWIIIVTFKLTWTLWLLLVSTGK